MTSSGPYVLRPWVGPVLLSADGSPDPSIKINCVEYYDGNLYVGTSASELLHFVRLPPDPASSSTSPPVFIPASRLTPPFNPNAPSRPGVQQILLLPRVGKACILCNRTVTFYSLPELTPSGTREVNNCNWIGGVDMNERDGGSGSGSNNDNSNSVVILLSTNRRIQVVKMEDGVRAVKNIDFAGSTLSVRRDSIACVADAKTYALIDVDHQLKIPLMSISSLDDGVAEVGVEVGRARSNTEGSQSHSRPHPDPHSQSHKKSRSTGSSETATPPPTTPQDHQAQTGDHLSSPSPPSKPSTPQPTESEGDKPLPPAPRPAYLKPHITSPTEEEFLVVIGTSPTEPGVGMFINLDGDPTRPTITFSRYPKEIVVDGSPLLTSQAQAREEEEEGYVLASLEKEKEGGEREYGIEIQRWDAGSEVHPEVYWLKADEASDAYGIRSLTSSQETYFDEVVEQLSMSRFQGHDQPGEPLEDQDWEASRIHEGQEFARRLARAQTRLAVWSGDQIWWAVRNPLVVQLDTKLEAAVDKRDILAVLSSIEGREPRTEMEFTTMGYIQQKGGLLLLINLLSSPADTHSDSELATLERVLVDSKLDPRVVLSLIPGVRDEIIEGRQGIWLYSGVKTAPDKFLHSEAFRSKLTAGISSLQLSILNLLRRYLRSWRNLKGFGSVSLEEEVFRTVDAALLLVLLELDNTMPDFQGRDRGTGRRRGRAGTPRAELNELVDGGMECFDRAITLLQTYRRLFVLSRLYQSRKMAAEVLATWRRIVEGEEDAGEELRAEEGEQRVRDYLAKISSRPLVQEYGVWLAKRNPRLGVQVFAEDRGKVRFEGDQAMQLLRREAPNAVRFYLEHLVFGKGDSKHVDELITFYMDVVLADLGSEEGAGRERVLAAYEAYRALQAPKPTYRHFLAENASDGDEDEAWQVRLRLLQLLGGPYTYDEAAVRERLGELAQDLLVPEAIILGGREGKHEDALRLLVHRLGDFDTAVAYCLRGGLIYTAPVDSQGKIREEDQRRLFRAVLGEFLALEDVSDRVQQTGALLDRFGRFFDVDDVLDAVPDDWSVDILAGFLVTSLRRLVSSRHEGVLTSALCYSSNLHIKHDLLSQHHKMGPHIQNS